MGSSGLVGILAPRALAYAAVCATAFRIRDQCRNGVRRRRHPRERRGTGWLDPEIESESVRLVAEATLTVVLFSDASRIDLAALRREYALPLRLLAIGLPLTIMAGALAGVAHARRARVHRGGPVFRAASPRRTLRWGRQSSPIPGFLHVSARGSTSRAASTTASACRCWRYRDRDRRGPGGRDRKRRGGGVSSCSRRSGADARGRDRRARSGSRGQGGCLAPPRG